MKAMDRLIAKLEELATDTDVIESFRRGVRQSIAEAKWIRAGKDIAPATGNDGRAGSGLDGRETRTAEQEGTGLAPVDPPALPAALDASPGQIHEEIAEGVSKLMPAMTWPGRGEPTIEFPEIPQIAISPARPRVCACGFPLIPSEEQCPECVRFELSKAQGHAVDIMLAKADRS
jgi:hypothetical protein